MNKLFTIADLSRLGLFVLGICIGVIVSFFMVESKIDEATAQESSSLTVLDDLMVKRLVVDHIIVRTLAVVDNADNQVIRIESSAAGGRITVTDKDAKSSAMLGIVSNGGVVAIKGKDGKSGVSLMKFLDGGAVKVHDKAGNNMIELIVTSDGGNVTLRHTNGNDSVNLLSTPTRGIVGVKDQWGNITGMLP